MSRISGEDLLMDMRLKLVGIPTHSTSHLFCLISKH